MKNRETLELDISAPGTLPAKLAEDAASILKENERVEIVLVSGRVVLRSVWEADADLALENLRAELQPDVKASAPRILYLYEPRLLEPVIELRITVPEQYMGEVMGDINRRRGLVEALEEGKGGDKLIACKMPLAELFGYIRDLRRMSDGNGSVEADFDSYQPAPGGPDPDEPDPDEPVSGALRA